MFSFDMWMSLWLVSQTVCGKRSEIQEKLKVTGTTQSGCHWFKPNCKITRVNNHMEGG